MRTIKRICKQCSKEFETAYFRIKHGRGKFCSKKCYWQWKSENSVGENNPNWRGGYHCIDCGRPINRQNKARCLDCYSLWQQVSENNPNWRGGKVQRVCEQCEKQFSIIPALVKNGGGKFCSIKCKSQWQSENNSGKNHPNWQGGISFEPYGIEFNDELKRHIRKRDNHACAVCGRRAKCVHHIDYDKKNNSPENLIVLCRSCHGKTTIGNRAYWQAYLTGQNYEVMLGAC